MMHTDEYTISLSRELAVCEGAIRNVRRKLAAFEHQYGCTTEEFPERVRSNQLLIATADVRAWSDLAVSLQAWTITRKEYGNLLLQMKR